MLKKLSALLLAVMMMAGAFMAHADSGAMPPDEVFYTAKDALKLISQRSADKAIAALGLNSYISAKELGKLIDASCRRIYSINVQDKYAVAWLCQGVIKLSVPLEEPTDGYVDAALFTLNERNEFLTISFVKWSDVTNELDYASQIKWCDEYKPSYRIFVD